MSENCTWRGPLPGDVVFDVVTGLGPLSGAGGLCTSTGTVGVERVLRIGTRSTDGERSLGRRSFFLGGVTGAAGALVLGAPGGDGCGCGS